MNTTITVALITSVSTLVGVGLTAWISAWYHNRQLQHQRALLHEQRSEERLGRQRELRRAAYERFLSQVDSAYRVLDEGWLASPFTVYPQWEAGFAARRALDEAAIRVQLEGPQKIADHTAAAVRSIGNEFRIHRSIFDTHSHATASVSKLDRNARIEALNARSRVTAEFTNIARQILETEPQTELDLFR